VAVGGSYTDQQLEGFMLVAVPLNAQDETTAMGTFQVYIHKHFCFIRHNQHLVHISRVYNAVVTCEIKH